MATKTKLPNYLFTKKGLISAAGKKWLEKNKHKFTLWLLDSRDDRTQIAVVHNSKSPNSRGNAWEEADFVYQIYSDYGLSNLDYDFIQIFGKRADVY